MTVSRSGTSCPIQAASRLAPQHISMWNGDRYAQHNARRLSRTTSSGFPNDARTSSGVMRPCKRTNTLTADASRSFSVGLSVAPGTTATRATSATGIAQLRSVMCAEVCRDRPRTTRRVVRLALARAPARAGRASQVGVERSFVEPSLGLGGELVGSAGSPRRVVATDRRGFRGPPSPLVFERRSGGARAAKRLRVSGDEERQD
jgi:hypothetical protein